MKLNFHNIGGNLFAFWLFVQSVYPSASYDTIYAAIMDGSILKYGFNLLGIWLGYQYGKSTKIQYVTEE
jgi:hypothetical protein